MYRSINLQCNNMYQKQAQHGKTLQHVFPSKDVMVELLLPIHLLNWKVICDDLYA